MIAKNVVGVVCGALMLAGCGVPDATAPAEEKGADETEIGEAMQAWGEGTCGQASPVVSWTGEGASTSPSGNYGDYWCLRAYVAGVHDVSANRVAKARYAGPMPNGTTVPCNTVQARVSMWASSFDGDAGVKVGDGPVVYGKAATPPFSGCVVPVSSIAIPGLLGDDFLVLAQAKRVVAGTTTYQPVTIQTIKQFTAP